MKKTASILFFLLSASFSFSQKFNFVNWTVEDGLIQSQASYICQDKYRQLWISTEGGISRFDGKKFTGYTVQDGLVANHVNTMFCDKIGNLWLGSNSGLSFFNGNNFTKLKTTDNQKYFN
jgi:ligand-binding sensor domain-containing protein